MIHRQQRRKTPYVIYALPEEKEFTATIEWKGNGPTEKMTLLQNGKQVKYTCHNGRVTVQLPKGLTNKNLAFSFKTKKTRIVRLPTLKLEILRKEASIIIYKTVYQLISDIHRMF